MKIKKSLNWNGTKIPIDPSSKIPSMKHLISFCIENRLNHSRVFVFFDGVYYKESDILFSKICKDISDISYQELFDKIISFHNGVVESN